ncbi:hypothetical protein ABV409_12825 [Flagellimonas sp. DF-77]|uniref:DUF7103 family protein n=1 Tax=Flagellimonas algarum TaxID=3230298 RepID=UPI0033923CFD
MNLQQIENQSSAFFEKVNHLAKLERLIAILLIFTPLILFLGDMEHQTEFRDSISNYFFMQDSYWFGSLLTLAAALFIYNGVQHISYQKDVELASVENRFGRGYNVIFGLALFGVLFFNHIDYVWLHYFFAIAFFGGCALAMLLTKKTGLKRIGDVLGLLTLVVLGVHFLLEYFLMKGANPFTLLWAEWVGLIFIAIYFVLESFERNIREVRYQEQKRADRGGGASQP